MHSLIPLIVTASKSSTFKIVHEDKFEISYLDGTGASGDYVSDTLNIAGVTVKGVQMGLANKATMGSGLMGIGYSENEASNGASKEEPFVYPNIIDTMLLQGLISRRAYSLYLNSLQSSTGSIIFGGLDTHKFSGDLVELPVRPHILSDGTESFSELVVVMTSLSVTGKKGAVANLTKPSFFEPVLLDSGTTFAYFPEDMTDTIYNSIGAVDDSRNTGLILVDCAILKDIPTLTFDFGFGTAANGVTIRVPIKELVFPVNSLLNLTESDFPMRTPWPSTCAFGIYTSGPGDVSILGDSFLRSAYVVYDLDSNVIGLAQTNFNSTSSSVVEFKADATGLPKVSGVTETSASATQTVVSSSLSIGGKPTVNTAANPTATGSGSGTDAGAGIAAVGTADATATKNSAASSSVPAVDVGTLIALGLSSAFAAMGGTWFLSLY